MTKTTENVTVTVTVSGSVLPFSSYENRAYYSGEVVVLTPELIEQTRDRNGASILDTIRSEARQLERWGQVRFREGDHSAEFKRTGMDDTSLEYRRREHAEEEAKKLPSKAEVRAGLRAVSDEFGPRETSQHSMKYPEPKD